MTLVQWALPQLTELLPLDEESLKEIILYTNTLPDAEATIHLTGLLGDTPKAAEFITSFSVHRSALTAEKPKQPSVVKSIPPANAPPAYAPPAYPVASQNTSMFLGRPHTNQVIEAANIRARDEQEIVTGWCRPTVTEMWSNAAMYLAKKERKLTMRAIIPLA
ncbi:hypothetical protein V500_02764 [Pseudogymnoascus sp. VKM F-4518 (FW-2643)]|nr:hypothetical protein V500_02764 [Pseudogymnoascus sp. VKM F-4518 (FW-2643)]